MRLEFIGVDPNTGQSGSPTVWVDEANADIVIQSYTADEATRGQCVQNTAPGHAKGIPDHESVIRIPARLVPTLREACDAAERAQL
ncbi:MULTISPECIES: hypothetical protein [Streptomyces]|uniref:Uncharacterized protein n=1 Tax=Streptomyces griseofuscus TaxID=146922 RepID=A0A426S2W5_9ACTN|nr:MULTISPECIES: hypothetical protein [Streptomyces]MYQ92045.1 hypothetical protein [Streptomyces sp. SID4946]RRQ77196.1 hypothetical protein CQW39_19320 [Streptomyces griseofuscus]RRQ83808.1 hypothetical protein CQW44_25045 [Streptomyces griseofuscus]SCF70126.1 hypothetical protein GA0115258_109776 [Streptomyces sp. LamerLS-31b]SCF71845.1 hypothetical protein GA0115256_113812 [Streptomyces sp. DconLS]